MLRKERTGSARVHSTASPAPDDQNRVGGVDRLLERLSRDEGYEPGQQHDVHDAPGGRAGEAGEQLDREQERRRQRHQQHRERDDVEARGAAGGEELGIVLEQVEERLCDRKGPEDRQVEVGPGGLFCKPAFGALLRRLGRSFGCAHPLFGRA
jgi:hypothetical protein